jgi:hypothetical protein
LFHLVPFGEYMLLRKYLPLDAIAAGPIDYSAGSGPRTIDVPGLPPVSPLVCYEEIFPGEVVASAKRPAWLLNVTNDAWFGDSAGPYQHFAIARTRAVEEGLPLVRAANTGISAVIDPCGQVVARLGLGQRAPLMLPCPKLLASRPPIPVLETGPFWRCCWQLSVRASPRMSVRSSPQFAIPDMRQASSHQCDRVPPLPIPVSKNPRGAVTGQRACSNKEGGNRIGRSKWLVAKEQRLLSNALWTAPSLAIRMSPLRERGAPSSR